MYVGGWPVGWHRIEPPTGAVRDGLEVIVGLVTIFLGIVGLGVALIKLTGKLEDKADGVRDGLQSDITNLRVELRGDIKGLRGEVEGVRDGLRGDIKGLRDGLRGDIKGLRDELRGDIKELRGEITGVRVELGGRIDGVSAELTKTRMAVARLEGHVLGVPLPDTAAEAATDAA